MDIKVKLIYIYEGKNPPGTTEFAFMAMMEDMGIQITELYPRSNPGDICIYTSYTDSQRKHAEAFSKLGYGQNG